MEQPIKAGERVVFDRSRYLPFKPLVLVSVLTLQTAVAATATTWQNGYVSRMGLVALAGLIAPRMN
jgi:hypothetical protein